MPPKKQKKPSTRKKKGKKKEELNDEQLEDVAGGIDTVPLPEMPAISAKKKAPFSSKLLDR